MKLMVAGTKETDVDPVLREKRTQRRESTSCEISVDRDDKKIRGPRLYPTLSLTKESPWSPRCTATMRNDQSQPIIFIEAPIDAARIFVVAGGNLRGRTFGSPIEEFSAFRRNSDDTPGGARRPSERMESSARLLSLNRASSTG